MHSGILKKKSVQQYLLPVLLSMTARLHGRITRPATEKIRESPVFISRFLSARLVVNTTTHSLLAASVLLFCRQTDERETVRIGSTDIASCTTDPDVVNTGTMSVYSYT